MLPKSTGSRDSSAVEIDWVRWVPKVLVVKQVGRKNTSVIEKKIGKTRRANFRANRNKNRICNVRDMELEEDRDPETSARQGDISEIEK